MNNINLSWQEVEELTNILQYKITEKKIEYSYIVGVNRGGLIPAVILSHKLNIPVCIITMTGYNGKYKRGRQVVDDRVSMIGQIFSGDQILIVDDISDSGNSLDSAIRLMQRDTKNIHTATIIHKEQSKITPDYYAKTVDNSDWVNFPWERDNG